MTGYASQAGQDRYVDTVITGGKAGGAFVDIGAYDGVTGSNTLFFERVRGWSGLLVEPVTVLADSARRARIAPCMALAVGARSGSTDFLQIERGYTQMSGFLETYAADLLARVRSHPAHRERIIQVPVLTLAEILDQFGAAHIDYLSMDVEGAEPAILSGFDFQAFDIDCWSIENNNKGADIRTIMQRNGYTQVEKLGVDEIYVKHGLPSEASAVANPSPQPNETDALETGMRSGVPDMEVAELSATSGNILYCPHDTFVGRSLATTGTFSPDEGELFAAMIEAGDTIVDAGAHIGWFTLQFASLVGPTGCVVAFEPQYPLFELLSANASRNGYDHVRTWHAALGECSGQGRVVDQRFDLPGNYGGAPLIAAGPGPEVAVMALDTLDLPRCDLIKADVQGMERALLIGAAETIGRHRPLLYLENDRQDQSPQLISTLFALGYRPFWHICPVAGPGAPEELSARSSINMVCVPEEAEFDGTGWTEIKDRNDWWRDLG